MEGNIFITGLEEYQSKLKEASECIDRLRRLGNELQTIIFQLHPEVEIKRLPPKQELKTSED